MTTGSSTSATPQAPPVQGSAPSEYDQYICGQLRKTQNYVRLVDVTEALLTILVAALAYLLFVSVLDHWLFSGGLPTWVRYLAWIGLLVSSLAYAVRTVLPHLLYRVSWLYAADAVERAEPSLKNSLLNFLMLRGDHRGVPQIIYQNLEQRAAADISQVPAELAVDRSRILKIGYLLIAVALACAVYKVLSPKDLLPSVGRVLAPWSDIPPQTRVKILNVQPGHAEALLLSQVPVQAEIRGLDDHETAQLVYSTTDQQAVDVAVPMYIRDGQRYHSCSLPEDPSGLSQDVEYRIEAGDCRSQTYRIRVVIAPTIHVKKIEYAYPPYTGLDPRTVEGVGDIKAIEGTLVVIHAEASHQIASGYVQLEGIRSQTIPLKFTGKTARCQLPLQRKLVGSESLPLWTNYRLNITTPQGAENENPIRHRIQIIPDLPPLVEIMKPGQASVSVPADGHLDVEVRARDQDYQLSDVRLVGEYQQGTLLDEPLANEQRPFAEPVRTSFRFEPQKYDLQPGDVVRYAAVAADNKTPTANQAVTADYEIIITEPENRSAEFPPADRPQDERQDERQDQPPGGAQGDDGQAGDGQAADGPKGQSDGDGSQGDQAQAGDGQGEGAAAGDQPDSGSSPAAGKADGRPEASSAPAGSPDTPPAQPGSTDQQQQQVPQEGTPDGKQPPNGDRAAGDRPEGEGTQSGRPESGGDPGGRAGQPRPDTPPSDPTDQPIDNPGEAFEKALEYIRQKQADQLAEADPREGQPRGGDPAGQTTPDGPAADSPGRSEPQAPADGDPPAGGPTGGDPPGGPSSDQAGESGAEASQAQPSTETDSRQPSGGSDQPSSADSRPDQVPGGGRGNQGQQPPAVPEGENRPRDKGGTAGQSKADQEPADSSVSRQQSDSAPGEEGSRAGQGDEGGGQRAAKEGEGAAGQQTPADSGDQASSESGPGETGARAGDKVPADRPTGQPGDPSCPACQRSGGACSACKGSGGRSGGSSAAGQPGAKPPGDGQPGATPGQPQGAGQPSPAQPGEGPAGDARGGGNFAGQDRTPGAAGAETPRQEPGADDANLQYARQQTELVLDYLQEQLDRGGVDQELKERFGWSDQQFADFVRRYGDLRARAKSAGEEGRAARQELDDTLRSLGLRRPAAELRSGRPKIDKAEGLQQSGRARPPQEYQEQFDAFRRDAFADE